MANKIQKLELTWAGKDERLNPEPRILIEDESKSYAVPVAEQDGLFTDEKLSSRPLTICLSTGIICWR